MPPAGSKPVPAKPWPGLKWGWQDAAGGAPNWRSPRAAEIAYQRQLKSVAGRIRQIVTGGTDPAGKQTLLRKFAETLGPWAEAAATRMATDVDRRNAAIWQKAAGKISAGLKQQLLAAVDGVTLADVIRRNAQSIMDLPLGAAGRIGDLAAKAMTSGMRAETLTKRIAELADASEGRARSIARTEVSKASTSLTRVRAASVQSEGYIWRTSRDGDVRDSHAHMEGKFVRWDDPQRLDGMSGHAGEFPNCRCYPEPVIPREDAGAAAPRTYRSPLPTAEEVTEKPQLGLLSTWELEKKEIVPHRDGEPLPGADRAVLDVRKLAGYALNPDHPVGGHKARVMAAALGVGPGDADMVRNQVLTQLPQLAAARPDPTNGAKVTDRDGERFTVRVPVTGPNGQTVEVVTAWIYDRPRTQKQAQSDAPRLVTLFIPRQGGGR
jgi:SPP1 gp7 family putative phage head morphogenesis protein